jgi:predicted transcriptional regulator
MNNLERKTIPMSPQVKLRARKALADLDDMRLQQLLETARRVERYAVGRSEQSVANALGKPLVFVTVMIAFCKSAGLLETKRARAKFLRMYGKKKVRMLYNALEAIR